MPFKIGHIPWNKGKINNYSDETKKKMGEAKIGNTYSVRDKNGNWKGGFKKTGNNGEYIGVLLPQGHKFSCMADKNSRVLLHRLIMAEYLNRPLTVKEVVHHINEDTTDNQIENLRLFGAHGKHSAYHKKLKEEGD